MLSKNQVVTFKKAIQRMYDCKATIIAYVESVDVNGVSTFSDMELYNGIPCKVQEESVQVSNDGTVSVLNKVIVLYCDTKYCIPIGSKILITKDGVRTVYKNSGIPAIFDGFQKFNLEYMERYA